MSEEPLVVLDTILSTVCLTDVQEQVFLQSWQGKTYQEIAESTGYDAAYIRDVGYKLWQLISKAVKTRVTKNNLKSVFRKTSQQSNNHTQPLQTEMTTDAKAGLQNNIDNRQEQKFDFPKEEAEALNHASIDISTRCDWGEAVDASIFYGRAEELKALQKWSLDEQCRLIAILGMGGVGKTTLSVKFALQIKDKFEYIIWRSLRNAPPVKDVVTDLICCLSNGNETEVNLPDNLHKRMTRLIDYLRSYRCLIILDNLEAILQIGEQSGYYRERYEGFNELIKRVGETFHKSCLILTSREKPLEFSAFEGEALPIRTLQLKGVSEQEGYEILKSKGSFTSSEEEWKLLISNYAGNPLLLKIASTTIKELFNSSVSEFLSQNTIVFDSVRDLLDQQFNRLSEAEKDVMFWLAINCEAISMDTLREDTILITSKSNLLEAISSINRRSLIERNLLGYTLQPVIMEYVIEILAEQICEEIRTDKIFMLARYALVKAQSKDYIRESQKSIIIKPIINKLKSLMGFESEIEKKLCEILLKLKEDVSLSASYAASNIISLLQQLGVDLHNYDFSGLAIWQAYLQGTNLHNVNFSRCNFDKSIFNEILSVVLSVDFSPNGECLATGATDGKICIWQPSSRKKLLICQGHTNWVWTINFSPDSQMIASGSEDKTVRLWNILTGQCRAILREHIGQVWSVSFSPDGQTLASGSEDQTIKLWDVRSGECKRTLHKHTGQVWSVSFSPDSQTLASGSDDQTVKLWNANTGECYKTLLGHCRRVRSVSFSPDGQTLASASEDQTIKLWDVRSGECKRTLHKHTGQVWSVSFSPDSQTLASGSDDQTVKLWNANTGECYKTLLGHCRRVRSVSFSPDGQTLASASEDQTIKLWDVRSGECKRTLHKHTGQVWSVSFSPDSQTLASGSDDQTMKLWNVNTGECYKTLLGHTNWLRSIAFSSDGQTLASSSDHTVKLWNANTGECYKTLLGHTNWLRSIAFSPDGQTLVSGGEEYTVKLWHVYTGECCRTLRGHMNWVWSVAFSPDGQTIASGGGDHVIKFWNVRTGECLKTFVGHTNRIRAVVFSPDGQTLASGSEDSTVKLWNVYTGEVQQTLQGHTGQVWSVTFSPDGQTLASGSEDDTVRLWNVHTGEVQQTLQGHTSRVWSVTFSPDGQTLASGSGDHVIKLWNVSTGKCFKTLTNHTDQVRFVAFGADKDTLISGSADQSVRVWNISTENCFKTLDILTDSARSIAYNSSTQLLATVSQDESLQIWNIATGECIKIFKSVRPYEQMNITDVTGLTDAQKSTLKVLGAIESPKTIA
ncbi:pentapeptide repeat-containing protein [Nodosilinea sp. LEGE 07298]|uniref:NACHT and WD40 repeat domain-containing protein n=1 Tax=Nodosilinea sp. LEGE 07298 TaxID=2777970 RepID=UPI0018822BBB|nr:NB-ARC domain-containing protein [Nodosilinea sp. LEGE 07298]MBE9108123.1 pentapeptide repeat-containing protein [Nodosilinea sp. LEGE 07298]